MSHEKFELSKLELVYTKLSFSQKWTKNSLLVIDQS